MYIIKFLDDISLYLLIQWPDDLLVLFVVRQKTKVYPWHDEVARGSGLLAPVKALSATGMT